jgi:hypothetical protein
MTEQWKQRLAHFDEVPVVDFFGVRGVGSAGGWASLAQKRTTEPEDIGFTIFDFDVWRIENGEVQTVRIHMTAIISYKEWISLCGSGGKMGSRVVHLKAKVAHNPIGDREALFVEWVGSAIHDKELSELHRRLNEPINLDYPPLPPLRLSSYDGAWCSTIVLHTWDGFYLQSEPSYGDGQIPGIRAGFPLSIASVPLPEVRLGYKGVPPSPSQVAAYMYLTQNEKAVQESLLRSILDKYPQWQQDYGVGPDFMPDVTHWEQFQSLLVLWDISISCENRDECAYIYLNLLPNWDIEHGLGAVLHQDRVVDVGDHDSIWNAIERDQKSK